MEILNINLISYFNNSNPDFEFALNEPETRWANQVDIFGSIKYEYNSDSKAFEPSEKGLRNNIYNGRCEVYSTNSPSSLRVIFLYNDAYAVNKVIVAHKRCDSFTNGVRNQVNYATMDYIPILSMDYLPSIGLLAAILEAELGLSNADLFASHQDLEQYLLSKGMQHNDNLLDSLNRLNYFGQFSIASKCMAEFHEATFEKDSVSLEIKRVGQAIEFAYAPLKSGAMQVIILSDLSTMSIAALSATNSGAILKQIYTPINHASKQVVDAWLAFLLEPNSDVKFYRNIRAI